MVWVQPGLVCGSAWVGLGSAWVSLWFSLGRVNGFGFGLG